METDWRGRPVITWILLGLLGTLGVRGLAGGGQFILDPSGGIIGVSTTVLAPTPVGDFLVPGLFLFVGLGVFPLAVLSGLYRGHEWARGGSVAVAVLLASWALVEGVVVGWGERLQYLNLVQAVVMLLLAGRLPARESSGPQAESEREA